MLLSELYSTRRLIERESKGKRDGRERSSIQDICQKLRISRKNVSTPGIEPGPQLQRQAAFVILLGAKNANNNSLRNQKINFY